ncbi:hypothetical protein O3G_MSEX002529 [Manduca sexta]|uniref:ATP synthase subunit gamma, mitochondrial n=1 Tax=Manduca sexta TaxID=7130 RepID=A0A921YPB8_MANSE|nr:hypothetical protein O3G_MSEX002529 [Manduca sexta]
MPHYPAVFQYFIKRFTRAERELEAARPFGYGPRKFYEGTKLVKGNVDAEEFALYSKEDIPKKTAHRLQLIERPEDKGKKIKKIHVAVTSDRGLCGGVHTGIARRIRRELKNAEPEINKLVCIGEKARGMLYRTFPQSMLISIKDIGRVPPVFYDAALVAAAIAESGYLYDVGEIFYNKYFSPVKYELYVIPFFNKVRIETAPNMHAFDEVDDEELTCYLEWTLAALLFFAIKESAAAEQSSRMSAMDNATKNADDMTDHLTLVFNRTRQAVITRELTEIISGAAALKNV